jgi:hypothetical protein
MTALADELALPELIGAFVDGGSSRPETTEPIAVENRADRGSFATVVCADAAIAEQAVVSSQRVFDRDWSASADVVTAVRYFES